MKIQVKCMEGIGDQIYVRAFIKKLIDSAPDDEIYIDTALPFLYSDLISYRVKICKRDKAQYRTQSASLSTDPTPLVDPPDEFDRVIYQHYSNDDLKVYNILGNIEKKFGFVHTPEITLDLPANLPDHGLFLPPKVAIIRPVTYRVEFHCTTKAPNPAYVGWCARVLKDAGYYVISIADCKMGEEWITGEEPPANLKLHAGEIGLARTLALFKDATVAVGGPGFMVPAAIAAGTNLFTIYGGRGGFDNPYQLLDLRLKSKGEIGWAMPNNFCRCKFWTHDCDKTINDLDSEFFKFMDRVNKR